MTQNTSPLFYTKAVVHPAGYAGSSYTALIPWVTGFAAVSKTAALAVVTEDTSATYPAGLYAQIPNANNLSRPTWKLAIAFGDLCTMVADGSIIELYLQVTADQSFGAGYRVFRNGTLTVDASLHADPYSVWAAVRLPASGGGSGGVASVNNQLPDGSGNVSLASTNLTDTASLLRATSLGAASGIATLDGSGKLTIAQLPTIAFPVSSVNGKTGVVSLASTDLTDTAGLVRTALVGAANGLATLDSGGKVPTSQLPAAVLGAMNYQSTWNANTNNPTLTSGTGTKGFYYTVAVAGSTNLDGITQWNVGDHAVYNGAAWEKIDGIASEVISVAGRTGVITLSSADITDFASAVTTPLSLKVNTNIVGQANGIATLGSDGKLTAAQVPASSNLVTSVAGRTGAISLTSSDLTDFGSAVTTPLGQKVNTSAVGAASGVASLDSGGHLPTAQLPTTGIVTSVASRSGAVTLTTADLTDFASAVSTPLAARVLTSSVGAANGVAGLDSGGKVPTSQLPAAVLGALNYQGTWNATTNSPSLVSATGTKGFYYTVSVAGSTNLDGITQWNVGDHAAYNGTAWEKLDGVASEVISVAGRTGVVTLTTADLTDYSATIGTPLSTATSNITTLQGQASAVPVALTSNDTWKGFGATSGLNAAANLTIWAPVYLTSSGTWAAADATSVSTAPCRGLAVAAATTGNPVTVLMQGVARHDAWTWTPGADIYLAVGGGLTQTKPTGTTGYVVQAIGYALSATSIRISLGSFEYITLS